MYDFVYLSVKRSVRDSHWSRDYRDGTGIRVFYENPGFYKDGGSWIPYACLQVDWVQVVAANSVELACFE
jgi:hypothetical protein